MKVQKTGLNFKIGSLKGKNVASSKILPNKKKEPSISKNDRDIQAKSKINQTYTTSGIAGDLSNVNKPNLTHSRQQIETRNIENLKSARKLKSSGAVPVDTVKTPALTSNIRKERIKEAKIRLAQGYYAKSEVDSKVAERIIDNLI